jgi:hypothetical protein
MAEGRVVSMSNHGKPKGLIRNDDLMPPMLCGGVVHFPERVSSIAVI